MLIFSVLVDVALLKLVIVPELLKLTVPPVLFVMPAIVPDPLRFIVPVFVKFASAVLIAPEPETVTVPALASVVTELVPLMLSVPEDPFVNDPAPLRAVPTVSVPLFVLVPVTATFGIEDDPLSVFPVPLNVCTIAEGIKYTALVLFVKLPPIVTVEVPVIVLFQ